MFALHAAVAPTVKHTPMILQGSNPHAAPSVLPAALLASVLGNRHLIVQMARREIAGRYRGSMMGLAWSFFNPVFMLVVYTFVFSVVFKARWNVGSTSKTEFALVLFAGLIVFNLFSECITRSPSLILANVNYVKKVVFPLEVLPWVALGSALFHFLISLVVWIIAYCIFFGLPQATVLLLPLVVIPLMLFTVGISWALASLGVFFRDVSQFVGLLMTVLMFLSPIFYPASAIPIEYRHYLNLNPLTLAIEQMRNLLFWGKFDGYGTLFFYSIGALASASAGFAWFQKTRKGFADVL